MLGFLLVRDDYRYMLFKGYRYMLVAGFWHILVHFYSGISHSDSVVVVSSFI
jgi:hypothetical protein